MMKNITNRKVKVDYSLIDVLCVCHYHQRKVYERAGNYDSSRIPITMAFIKLSSTGLVPSEYLELSKRNN